MLGIQGSLEEAALVFPSFVRFQAVCGDVLAHGIHDPLAAPHLARAAGVGLRWHCLG
eukprot:CAMPEP_0179327472 /NCGR_PEP_ID=MMETSP0797-20121207/61979_1 /TAXON_ID=47934 /ORGANISM="Dinophysis acuminata, Strain DAEP01" /LENGTH=56 /DNA_ID=CAMNT_0021039797 /DNA_START=352 /DNA_END=518 /DNA_ORIENTATION=-